MTVPAPSSYPASVTVIRTDAEGTKRADIWSVAPDEIHKLYMLLGEPESGATVGDGERPPQ